MSTQVQSTSGGRPTGGGLGQSVSALRRARTSAELAVTIALAALATALRVGRFTPPSLFFDDAWVALVSKARGLGGVVRVGSVAPGFTLLLKFWLWALGFSNGHALSLSFVFSVLVPPTAFVVLRRRGLSFPAAAAAGLILAVSGMNIALAVRVKQYSLDEFLAVILLGMGWALVEDPRRTERWRKFGLASLLGIALSSPAVVIIASGLAATSAALRKDLRFLRAQLVRVAAPLAVFAAVWYWFLLRPASNSGLQDSWNGYYIPLGAGLLTAARRCLSAWYALCTGALGTHHEKYVAVAVAASFAALIAGRRLLLALLLGCPIILAYLLAAIRVAPIGTGRTDTYLYPAIAMAVAAAVDLLIRVSPRIGLALVALAMVGLLVDRPAIPAYPRTDFPPLVTKVESSAAPGDTVIITTGVQYGFALYTRWPIRLVRCSYCETNYRVIFKHPNVENLDESAGNAIPSAMDRIKSRNTPVWMLIDTTRNNRSVPLIASLLQNMNYKRVADITSPGLLLERWVSGGPTH
jgi:hypothetical protein